MSISSIRAPLTAVLLATATVAVAGCADAARTAIRPAGNVGIPAGCPPSVLASLPAETWAAARRELAPPGAGAIRLCRYSGLNARPRLRLVGSRLLRQPGLVRELVSEFDRLPRMPPGVFACPADDGSQIAALLRYPGGQAVTVTVGLTGCQAVTNGSVPRTAAGLGTPPPFGPALVAQLEQLVPGHRGPGPGSAAVLAHGRWSLLARSPLGRRYEPTLVWDGRELLEVGGTAAGPYRGAPQDGAAAYDPARRRWRRLAVVPAVVQPAYAASVWTGRELFVFGGAPGPGPAAVSCCVAGLYDPASDRWSVSARAPLDSLEQPTDVWTGRAVILAGLHYDGRRRQLEIAVYDPAGGTWTRLAPPISPQHVPLGLAMLATDHEVLLWSLWQRARPAGRCFAGTCYGVDVLALGPSGRWMNVTGSWPQDQTVDGPIFTGSEILLAPGQIWCGACSVLAPVGGHGYMVDPRTLRLTPIPHGPLDDLGPQILWTGAAEISFNSAGEIVGPDISVLPGDIAIWNPATRRWARGPRAPRQPGAAPAVWSGYRLYVLARDGNLLAYGG